MKAKYLFLTALSCMVMMACQGNDPDKNNGNGDKQSSDVIERLNGLVDNIGSIVSSVTQEDGTIVMTDDCGNTIKKDKEGNIIVLTKDGAVILVDYSINEDPSAAKDKWYNTKWTGFKYSVFYPEYDPLQEFLNKLNSYGFQIEERPYMSKDTIVIRIVDEFSYNMSMKTTTCAIQNIETQTEYTYQRTCNYVQYVVSPESVEKQGTTYRYEVTVSDVNPQYYLHAIYAGQNLCYPFVYQDSILVRIKDYQNLDTQEKILSRSDTTIFYNYRRLDDTQLAVYNNSESYIFEEITSRKKPYMSMSEIDGDKLAEFELLSF